MTTMEKKQQNPPQKDPRDPTPEEIWGPGGLAEQERMKRPEEKEAVNKARNEYRKRFKEH
jgi:hypothetical protein